MVYTDILRWFSEAVKYCQNIFQSESVQVQNSMKQDVADMFCERKNEETAGQQCTETDSLWWVFARKLMTEMSRCNCHINNKKNKFRKDLDRGTAKQQLFQPLQIMAERSRQLGEKEQINIGHKIEKERNSLQVTLVDENI